MTTPEEARREISLNHISRTLKPWFEMTPEEREAVRAERREASGGAECDFCGQEDWEDQMTTVDDRLYCEACFQNRMEEEEKNKP